MKEHQWIHSIRKGDKSCLQDIAVTYYDDIYRFCAYQTGSREDAYDLTQETFLRFIRYIEGYHDSNLKGYLLTIAMNVCRSYLAKKRADKTTPIPSPENWQHGSNLRPRLTESRKQNPDDDSQVSDTKKNPTEFWQQDSDTGQFPRKPWQQPSPSESPEEQAVRRDIHDRLIAALSKLPEIQREAILLHYLQDMKYREIGKRTGVSVATVKSRVHQGIEKLQKLLREEDF